MTIPKMPISSKRLRLIKRVVGEVATAAHKTLTTEAGGKTVKQAGGKAYRILKKKGISLASAGEAVKAFGGALGTGLMKVATARPKQDIGEMHALYVAKQEAKYGKRTAKEAAAGVAGAKWPKDAKKEFLGSITAFASRKIEGVDYKMTPETIDRRHRIASRIAKGVLGAGTFGVVAHSADKMKAQGYFEGPHGGRFETTNHAMSLKNPEGRGSRVDLGMKYRSPKGHTAEVGGNMGFGHSNKAGWAHQAGVRLKVNTPLVKTGWELGEQHAFGTKVRSRRVAAIRRAVFGREQHLGIEKKPTKKAKRADSLM